MCVCMVGFWLLQCYVFLVRNEPKGTYHVLTIWNHHHQLGIMIPYHSPEVLNGVQKGMLGDDKFIALVITLQNQRQDKRTLIGRGREICFVLKSCI